MSAFSDKISRVLLATPTLARGSNAAARRWGWLRTYLFDPYRPELHYMRGAGPRWREKNTSGAGLKPTRFLRPTGRRANLWLR
jgi:hypothetical protein